MLGVVQDACPGMVLLSQVINHAQTISIPEIGCYRSKLFSGKNFNDIHWH
jgi:phage tail protein X